MNASFSGCLIPALCRRAWTPSWPAERQIFDRFTASPTAAVWAAEYGPDGVRVNAVAAGPTRTEGTAVHGEAFESAGQAVALKRLAEAEEIAGPIAFLASPAASYVNGATLSAMGGQPALG